MKKLILSLMLLSFTTAAQAAGSLWLEDFAAAQAQAKKSKRKILIDFTGSDWCPPCKTLHRNVLAKPEFEQFAKKNLILVMADFPRSKPQSKAQKKKNQALAKRFAIRGYPTIVILTPAGKVLSKEVGYRGENAAAYIAKIRKLKD